MTKSGAGTLTLSGANTYTGTTTVSAGTLRLNRSGGTTIRVESNVTVQSGGTLQISSNQTLNNLTVNSGGTLIVDDGITLTVSGTATYNGKVVVNSSSFSSSATIADLEINRSGGVTLGSNITVSGTLTLTSGTLDIGSNTLTISGNSVARSSGNIDADAGTIAFTNTSALTLPTSTFSGSINNLTMNGNGGVTLSSSETVSGKLTLTNGKITTGANKTLTISSTNNDAHASPGLSGGSSSSYIVGNLLRKVSGSGSYKFPVGTSANYQEATTDFTSSNYSADLTASFTATPVSSGSLSGVSVNGTSLTGALNAGYWTISQSSGLNTPAYSITLKMTGHTNSQGNANRYAVIKNNGSGWLSQGTHTNNTQTETGGVVTAVRSALNSFSDFSIGFGGYPLPVTFTSLSGRVNGSQAHLTWNVAQEIDVDRYEVEESVNGRQFRPLTEVDAVNRSSYNAVDAQLHPGSNYYRVKAVDIDGKLTYSKIIRLDNGSSGQNILIYPNPTRGELNLTLNNLSADTYRIQVINAIGQTVFRQSLVHDGSNRSLPLNLSKLPTGIYQVQISNGTTAITQPVKIDQ